jgi:hypothetical protein
MKLTFAIAINYNYKQIATKDNVILILSNIKQIQFFYMYIEGWSWIKLLTSYILAVLVSLNSCSHEWSTVPQEKPTKWNQQCIAQKFRKS